MREIGLFRRRTVWACSLVLAAAPSARAAEPNKMIAEALAIQPTHAEDVTIDTVAAAEQADCRIVREDRNGAVGQMVYGPTGLPLRWIGDSDGDRKPDIWSYYYNGVEVYRDLDTNGDQRVDRSQWLGTAGTRLGVDENQDGSIDRWQSISPEEVTLELVRALAEQDVSRFTALLPGAEQVQSLGLGSEQTEALSKQVEQARTGFATLASRQKVVDGSSRWLNFGADKPGVVPAGTNGSTTDILAYENVAAIVETGGQSRQLLVGSLISVGNNNWRLVSLPRSPDDTGTLTSTNFFFSPAATADTSIVAGGLSEKSQQLLADLQKIEADLANASAAEKPQLNARRAEIMLSLYNDSPNPEDKTLWVRQLADVVSTAYQADEFPSGLEVLNDLRERLPQTADDSRAYVAYRVLTGDFNSQFRSTTDPTELGTIQKEYLTALETFAENYPSSPDAAEAMTQLGLNAELAGRTDEAIEWYRKTSEVFEASNPAVATKAKGAVARLTMENKTTMRFSGETLEGTTFRTDDLKSPVLIVHFWSSWCGPCKEDMEKLHALRTTYPDGVALVGINLDSDRAAARKYLQTDGRAYDWTHIYQEGGMNSGKLATALGVFSLPVTIVAVRGDDGRYVVRKSTTLFGEEARQVVVDQLDKK